MMRLFEENMALILAASAANTANPGAIVVAEVTGRRILSQNRETRH
jgi:hypothetical protein